MRIFGTILPYLGKVIGPCDADGIPAVTQDEERAAHFETVSWCFAWFGFVAMFPTGEPMRRLVDPSNPRRYAPGNL